MDDLPELTPASDLVVLDFEFDDHNIAHMARHGLTEAIIREIHSRQPAYATARPGRSGSHVMIGAVESGRYWTVIMTEVDAARHRWRPITGWPSVKKEVRAWRERH